MQQKIIWFILFLVSVSLVYYWNFIRDEDRKAMHNLEYNDEQLTGDVTQTTEVYARLEKKWIGSSKHIQNLEIKTDTTRKWLNDEIESTNNRFDNLESKLEDYIDKQTKKNKEIEKNIDDNHKDMKKSIKNVKKDIKNVEVRKIKPLETKIKEVEKNKELLDRLMKTDVIIKALKKLADEEAKEAGN